MRFAPHEPFLVRLARLLTLAAVLAASVCSAQDKRQATKPNVGQEEDEIKHLISMYARAADEADPTLASRVWCDSSEDSLTRLVREWRDEVHLVNVEANGYEYKGGRYKSLSQIARLITGTRWSGPLFFGINGDRTSNTHEEVQ